jgi:hypothetical protein
MADSDASAGNAVAFEDMLRGIMSGDASAIESASEEDLLRLQKAMNPYGGPTPEDSRPGHTRALALSYTNQREDYIERFTMTSLVGFLFRMYREWEVPSDARRWDPAAFEETKGRARVDPAISARELVAEARKTLEIAEEALKAEEAALASAQKAKDADVLRMIPDHTPSEGLRMEASSSRAAEDEELSNTLGATAKAERGAADCLRFIAHRGMARAGAAARKALPAAAKIAASHPEVQKFIEEDKETAEARCDEIPAPVAKEIIGQFLRTWFEYDPDAHVRGADDEVELTTRPVSEMLPAEMTGETGGETGEITVDAGDPERLTIKGLRAMVGLVPAELKAVFAAATKDERTLNATKAVLAQPSLVDGLAPVMAVPDAVRLLREYLCPIPEDDPARPALDVIPPRDSFHRWGYYRDVNFEKLRSATEAIYAAKPDLDLAISWFETFEGTPDEVDAAFNKYKEMHSRELRSELYSVKHGGWTLIGPWENNRKRIDFYNHQTQVLQRIMERHEEDQPLGAELMKKRVMKVKAKNIAEDGPDHPGLATYRSTMGTAAGEAVIDPKTMSAMARAKGDLSKVRELEDFSKLKEEREGLEKKKRFRPWVPEETARADELDVLIKRAEEMLEVPDDGIQVDFFTHDAEAGEMLKGKFYTKAEAPEAPTAGGAGGPSAVLTDKP